VKKSIRALIALNVLTVAIALMTLGVGGVAAVMAAKMEGILTPDAAATLKSTLNKKIGKSYTSEFHEKVVGLLESETNVAKAGAKTIRSYSVAMFQIGSLNFVTGAVCLVLAWRTRK
jgi:hypothetical protein